MIPFDKMTQAGWNFEVATPRCLSRLLPHHGWKKHFMQYIVNGKLYLSHLGKKGNEYLSHPTKPL